MSRSDPYEIGRCTCGHLLTLHVPIGGTWRDCSASTCRCERYTDPAGGAR